MLAFIFFDHPLAYVLMMPLGLAFPRFLRKSLAARRRERLKGQFRESLLFFSAAVSAGYVPENAFAETLKELRVLCGEKAMMTREYAQMINMLEMNVPVESCFAQFAERTGIEDIEDFAEVFRTYRKMGGNLHEIVRRSTEGLVEKWRMEEEISASLASRRLEAQIMSVMPLGILLYLRYGMAGFLSVMYETAAGRIAMGVCLAVYAGAWLLSRKLVSIRV